MTALSVELVQDLEGLRRLRVQWDALWREVTDATVFQSHTWVHTWAEVYHAHIEKLFIVTCWRSGELIGVAPLYIRRRTCGTLSLRQLMYCGTGEPESVEVVAEYMNILSRESDSAACEVAVASMAADSAEIDGVLLRQIVSTSHGAFARAIAGRYRVLQSRARGSRYVIPVTGHCPPETFSPSMKRTVASRLRRLQRQADVAVVDAGDANMTEIFNALVTLHNARWQGRGQPGVFSQPLFREFHHRLITRLLNEDRVMLFGLRVGKQIIAVHYCLVSQGTVHFYQSGIDDTYRPNVSPGVLCHVIAHRRCHERGYVVYDLMMDGENSYKSSLGKVDEQVVDLFAYRSSFQRYKDLLMSVAGPSNG